MSRHLFVDAMSNVWCECLFDVTLFLLCVYYFEKLPLKLGFECGWMVNTTISGSFIIGIDVVVALVVIQWTVVSSVYSL